MLFTGFSCCHQFYTNEKDGLSLNVIKLRRSLQMNKESYLQAFPSHKIDMHDEKHRMM